MINIKAAWTPTTQHYTRATFEWTIFWINPAHLNWMRYDEDKEVTLVSLIDTPRHLVTPESPLSITRRCADGMLLTDVPASDGYLSKDLI